MRGGVFAAVAEQTDGASERGKGRLVENARANPTEEEIATREVSFSHWCRFAGTAILPATNGESRCPINGTKRTLSLGDCRKRKAPRAECPAISGLPKEVGPGGHGPFLGTGMTPAGNYARPSMLRCRLNHADALVVTLYL